MSFRRRNIALSSGRDATATANADSAQRPSPAVGTPLVSAAKHEDQQQQQQRLPGTRPSHIDGRLTTSVGTASLDNLLAGHGGLALGSSLLIEECGTTDFAGALLRHYAAEGVVQGQKVHVVGVGEGWGRTLPGLVGTAEKGSGEEKKAEKEKMKIAWRYERLGNFGNGVAGPRAPTNDAVKDDATGHNAQVFCHAFDLTKRLIHPGLTSINYIPVPPSISLHPSSSPFTKIIQALDHALSPSAPTTVHRVVIPSVLSPALYPAQSCEPNHLLRFLHSIRALLARYPNRLTFMLSLPTTLYPRTSGLIRWAELLSDGVFELVPFPHSALASAGGGASNPTTSAGATAAEEPPQGMLRIHRLPIYHDRGGGGGDEYLAEDWAFTLSRRHFTIVPFNLPPVEGDNEAQAQRGSGGNGADESGSGGDGGGAMSKVKKASDLEF